MPMPTISFGKFEVFAHLATGTAANIFLARRNSGSGIGRVVVLKTPIYELAGDESFLATFTDEAKLASLINHPGVVKIMDVGEERGIRYIAMEYIFGETLQSLLSNAATMKVELPPPLMTSIMANASEALHQAHELKGPTDRSYKLIHRDITPQNIMVTFEGQAKVLDFGIAKAATEREATAVGIIKGKYAYMSPEQLSGSPMDRRSDIYSLGVVLFECVTGQRLFSANTPQEFIRLRLSKETPKLRDVKPDAPEELEEICAKALADESGDRYATAREFAEALRTYLRNVKQRQDPGRIATLLNDRFGPQIGMRRWLLERAAEGDFDEGRFKEHFGARPVTEDDFKAAPRKPKVEREPEKRTAGPGAPGVRNPIRLGGGGRKPS